MKRFIFFIFFLGAAGIPALSGASQAEGEEKMPAAIERKTCQAPDGVRIVYSAAGAGDPALVFVHGGLANGFGQALLEDAVFIHGGLADRTFWDAQLKAFADHHRVLALDLAGHGESGTSRKKWGIPEFGADVRAVIDAEKVKRAIIFGNSLGGPVAIEAALLLPGRALGVVGVDTFQDLRYTISEDEAKQRAALFRRDFSRGVREMVNALFHPDADAALVADAERRMLRSSPEAAYAMFLSLAGYDTGAPARRLTVPLRAINGDLFGRRR
jgi:pimeloyl-ACP methyl ester carboxylesterase